MPLQGQFAPEKTPWVADQLAKIDAAGDTAVADIDGRRIVVFTIRGAKSGLLRRVPLMRVTDGRSYLAVASKGGAPQDPIWYRNMVANPDVSVQDGTEHHDLRARRLSGQEREEWWERAVEAFPPYADYATKTDRQIPLMLCEPLD